MGKSRITAAAALCALAVVGTAGAAMIATAAMGAGAADAFVAAVRRALGAFGRDAEWRSMRAAAFAARFTWDRSARDYLAHLYQERG